nr:MAG TPA: Diheme cytochrome c [Caudoviricetes sp.]
MSTSSFCSKCHIPNNRLCNKPHRIISLACSNEEVKHIISKAIYIYL